MSLINYSLQRAAKLLVNENISKENNVQCYNFECRKTQRLAVAYAACLCKLWFLLSVGVGRLKISDLINPNVFPKKYKFLGTGIKVIAYFVEQLSRSLI